MFDFKKTLVLLFILLCHSLHVLLHHIHELPLTSSFPSFLPIFVQTLILSCVSNY